MYVDFDDELLIPDLDLVNDDFDIPGGLDMLQQNDLQGMGLMNGSGLSPFEPSKTSPSPAKKKSTKKQQQLSDSPQSPAVKPPTNKKKRSKVS